MFAASLSVVETSVNKPSRVSKSGTILISLISYTQTLWLLNVFLYI